MSRAAWLLVWIASCAPTSTKAIQRRATLTVEELGQPVTGARVWTTALAPNKRGGWNFIAQTYEYQSDKPTEFVVLDLFSGKYTLDEGPPGSYANSNYQIAEQLRAPNGRIFFPELDNRIAYYDPADEHVHQLPPTIDGASGDKFLFRVVFGPDGQLYGGTQSNGFPAIFTLDPETLKVRFLGRVGEHRLTYSYAYYLGVDPPWIYVAVGENPWELVALDMRTGKSRVLATRGGDGFMQLDAHDDGVTATLISSLRTPEQQTSRVRCLDGTIVQVATQQLRRHVRPVSHAIANAPELDLRGVVPNSLGIGHVKWRLSGDWKSATFRVSHTAAIAIDSLTALPDGSVLGSVQQYHGFFEYSPTSKKLESYGDFALSSGPRLLVGDHIYMSGYPNSPLWRFDPRAPWSETNPTNLGAFSASATHYAYFLRNAPNGKIYFAGRRERDGIGSGIGYYDIDAQTFFGHHEHLEFLDPQGLEVYGQRIIFSGRLHDDPSQPGATPHEAQLVVFDDSLHEVERLTVKNGLSNTGELFPSESNDVVLGLVRTPHGASLYRYDLDAKRLLAWRDIPSVGPVTSDPIDHALWLIIERDLVRVDPRDLKLDVRGQLLEKGNVDDVLRRVGSHLYWADGSQLRDIVVR